MKKNTVKKVHGNQKSPENHHSDKVPTPETLQIVCLRKLGWTVQQVAQMCHVSERAVYRRCEELSDYFADMPTIQAAKDAIQCLIPKSVKVYEKSLDAVNVRGVPTLLAADVATKILISNKVTTDRKVIEDEREQPTDRLLEELDKIQSGFAHSPAGSGETGSDTGDTPRS